MKKALHLLISVILCLTFVACGKTNEHIGEAKTPSGSSVMAGRDYKDVSAIFAEKGFSNIQTEPIEDLITGWLTKEGEVEKVSVGGDEGYAPDKWVPADTEVIIYYHTFSSEEGTTDTSKEESNEKNGIAAWLSRDLKEFEFELNSDGESYTLTAYNCTSPEATEVAEIPATYEGLPVTEIGLQAFYDSDNLEKVVIPEGISRIGPSAFGFCNNLVEIVFPESLRIIDEYAFENCDSLIEISILNPVSIGFSAFQDCEELKTLILGTAEQGGVHIDDYAFDNCYGLETAMLEGVSWVGSYAFSYCKNLKYVGFSSELTWLDEGAFWYCEGIDVMSFKGVEEAFVSVHLGLMWDQNVGMYEIRYIE